MATNDKDLNARNFGGNKAGDKGRGLATTIPRPNIVRIEILDGKARERYLGDIQKVGDAVKSSVYEKLVKNKDIKTFYGFIKNAGTQTFGFNVDWDTPDGGGGLLGSVKSAVKWAAGGSIVKGFGASADISRDLTGINAKFTGSSSLKRFNGVKLNEFTVDCGWYLPEQFRLCSKSLEILHRMAYPIQVDDKNLPEALSDELGKVVNGKKSNDADNAELDVQIDQLNAQITAETDPEKKTALETELATATNAKTELQKTNLNTQDNKSKDYRGKSLFEATIKALNKVNLIFGRNLTFDPLPVRVCIGQYIDVEPVVINKVAVTFSKENFINDEGRHVPITCSVSIGFSFWLTPAPKLQFLSLFGNELFGEFSSLKEKQAADKAARIAKEKKKIKDKAQALEDAQRFNVGTRVINT